MAGEPYLEPSNGGTRIAVDRDHLTVGRLADNDIQLDDPMVSRHHARLVRRGGSVEVQDAGSANGTFVNGVRIQAATPLKEGDSVRFGAPTFQFHGSAATTDAFPAPTVSGEPAAGHPGWTPPSPYPPSGPQAPQPAWAPAPASPQVPPGPASAPFQSPAPPGYAPQPAPAPVPQSFPVPQYPNGVPRPAVPPQPGTAQGALDAPGEPAVILSREQTTFGREPSCDFVFADPSVSARHAMIARQGESYVLVDVGSTGGTFVNGQRIMAPYALRPGDEIRIGRSTFFFRSFPAPGR